MIKEKKNTVYFDYENVNLLECPSQLAIFDLLKF